MLSAEQGKHLTNLARNAISSYFNKRRLLIDTKLKEVLSEKLPVFVILQKNGQLRGSMGFTDTIYPLYEGVPRLTINAAFSDPRFPPLDENEFEKINITVSVLTKPSLIEVRNPEDYLKIIVPGRDGIMVVSTFHSGILLPDVAITNKLDAESFLRYCCMKATLHPESWRDFNICRVYRFQTQVFKNG